MDAGSGRLERAADRIYLILGIYRDKMPNEAVEALQGVAAALGAAQEPAQEPVAWLTVDTHGRPIGSDCPTLTREDAENNAEAANDCWMNEETNEGREAWAARKPFHVVPLYAAPSRPGGA